jgi:hypothetical protein
MPRNKKRIQLYVCWTINGRVEQAAMETLRGLWGSRAITELRLTFPEGRLALARITTASPDQVRQAMETAAGLFCVPSEREALSAQFVAGWSG